MRSVELSRGPKPAGRPEKDFWDILYGEGDPLGPRRRRILLIIIAAGILTFFIPLLTTDPAVLGRSHWSLFELAGHIYQGDLPFAFHWPIDLIKLPLETGIVYFLLLCLLGALYFPDLHRHLAAMAAAGILFTLGVWRYSGPDFELALYGHSSYPWSPFTYSSFFPAPRHVQFGELILALLAVYGFVLFVVVHEDLEGESSPKEPLTGERAQATGEPEFLHAEILPPEEGIARPRHPRRSND
jgi:hypothetical protein